MLTAGSASQADPRGGVPGACCDTVLMTCSIRDQASCEAVGGVFVGDNTTCDACFESSSMAVMYAIEDTFELQAAPEATYGSAGALNVSGPQARNYLSQIRGTCDTWMKFDPIPAIVQFDNIYGPGNWVVVSAELSLYEDPAPNHPIFGIGTGKFSITWMASDNWSQGNGRPNSPGVATGNQIGFNYGRSILNAATDELLGNTYETNFAFGYKSYFLPLTPGFSADLRTPDPVSLYLTAIDARLGYTFNSGSHTNSPRLTVVADVAPPPPPCRGDINGDSHIRGDDIQGFVAGYLAPGSLTPNQFALVDMNASSTLDAADISCFVSALLSTHECAGGPYSCP